MIPETAFQFIKAELERKPLEINKYRPLTGKGRSQAFGVVNKRCLPPDYSRLCWLRPYLYKLLLDFGNEYVKDISWNSITVNQNYQANAHYDKHNIGDSFLVAFGDFEQGELVIHEGDLSGVYNIRHTPIQTNFSKCLHSVRPFVGNRYSLVYYKYDTRGLVLPEPTVRIDNELWVFYRGTERIDSKIGLPHPLRKEKKR
jgi:hypothetical protein